MPLRLSTDRLENLPGWEILAGGLEDIAADRVSVAACLVWIAWPRLHRAGLIDDALLGRRPAGPEAVLYRLLREEGGNAFSRYNAMLRRLIRFEHALDREMRTVPSEPV